MPTQRLEEKRVEECMGEGEMEKERERMCWGGRERGTERERAHADRRERERERVWLLLLYVSLPPGLPCANWAQSGVLSVLPEVFTLVLGPSFDLPYFLATAILDSFSLFYLPNSLSIKTL